MGRTVTPAVPGGMGGVATPASAFGHMRSVALGGSGSERLVAGAPTGAPGMFVGVSGGETVVRRGAGSVMPVSMPLTGKRDRG